MSAIAPRYSSPRVAGLATGFLSVLISLGALCTGAQAQGPQAAPPPAYFISFAPYYDGDYVATQQALLVFLQGAIKNPLSGFWIDSICFETMRGECFYQMGQHAAAYVCYENALRLLCKFNDWMLSVQFPPVVTPAPAQQLVAVPWYLKQRQSVVGAYPATMNIMQGKINNNQAVFQGGVVTPAVLLPIYAQEIVRCSCLAIRRWRELLGPACPYSQMTRDLVSALGQRPAWPNHWSEAWIDVQLGLAYAAAGKDAQARKTLEKAELASGLFDHPFTGTVHLELGRLDMEAGNYKAAQQHFLEASWAAAQFSDLGVIEEALRYGAQVHFMSQGPAVPYVPLVAATAWATAAGYTQLQASLLLSSAENQSLMNQPELAAGLLNQATVLTARTDLPRAKLGARMNHLKSLASYQLGRVEDGDFALGAAMLFQTGGSLWLYHIGLIDVLWNTRDITERTATDLYTIVLRDPTPTDWLADPLESLSVLTVPHGLSFQNWFEASLVRKTKDHEQALEISDRARRHRFLCTTQEGGRLLNLRWLLEAAEKSLDNDALLQRQGIFARYPEYEKKSREAKRLRSELRKLPLAPDDKEVAQQQSQMLQELAATAREQEVWLRQISVRREPGNLVFPPVRTYENVQASLAEGQSLLAFYSTLQHTYAFLVGKDKYSYSEITPPKKFPRDVTTMLRLWGNFEQNKEMKLDDLQSEKWQGPARDILSVLVKSSKADFTKTRDELVIVPDGMLWYVPFEALPVFEGDRAEPLINKVRIRYAPTVGLAVGESRPRKPDQNMAVALGRLFPRDGANLVDKAFDDLALALPGATAIRGKLPANGAIYSSLFDRLIVLNEIAPSTMGYDWSPLQIDNKSSGGSLADWLVLPFGGPDQVILPGFRTPAERSLKGVAKEFYGDDLFLSICGLMGDGARTVLISRWRTGGQSSVDLVREFAQELPHTTASDAWQRSVQLVSNTDLNAEAEPRLKLTAKQDAPRGSHPFFWAGYLLADTGAIPMTDEEEQAADQVLAAKPPAVVNPAAPAVKAMPLGDEMAGKAGEGRADEANKKKLAAKDDVAEAKQPAAEAEGVETVAEGKPAKPVPKAKRVRPPRPERKKAASKTKRAPA
jgi:hypothetical protein